MSVECKTKIAKVRELYYVIGKQTTPLLFQIQSNKEGDYRYTKRMNLLDLSWSDNDFIEQINNRTTLKNEIVFDFDPGDFSMNKTLYAMTLFSLNAFLSKNNYTYSFFKSGGRGVHCHAYDDKLFFMSELDRVRFKGDLLKRFGCDPHLKFEKTTITCEFAKNSKSNRYKLPIDIYTDLQEVLDRW